MFETASKMKLRFATTKGNLTTEDLWDLPLATLDIIARGLHRELKSKEEESFIKPKTETATTETLALEIVKRVIEVKLAEIEAREQAANRKAKKERLLGIIAEKEDDKLKKTSLAELRRQVEEL
jgi:hypothetical protein